MDQINGAVALQFAQHVGAMNVHRLVAEIELEGDFLDAVAFNEQIKHFAFTRGEHLEHLRRLLSAAQRPQGIGAQVVSTHTDGTHRLHELFRAAAFGQIAAGAGIKGALHEGRGVVNAENNGAKLRLLRAQAL